MREENGRAAREPDDQGGSAGPEGGAGWRPDAGEAGRERAAPADGVTPDHRRPLPDHAEAHHGPDSAPDGHPGPWHPGEGVEAQGPSRDTSGGGSFGGGHASGGGSFGAWPPLGDEPAERDVFGGTPVAGLDRDTGPCPGADTGPYPGADAGMYPDSGLGPYTEDGVPGASATDLFGNAVAEDGAEPWPGAAAPAPWPGGSPATDWSWTDPSAAGHDPGPAPSPFAASSTSAEPAPEALPYVDHPSGTPAGQPYRTADHTPGASGTPAAPHTPETPEGSAISNSVPPAARSPFLPPGPFVNPGESGLFASSDRLDVGFNPPTPGPVPPFAPAPAAPWPAVAPDPARSGDQGEPALDSPAGTPPAAAPAATDRARPDTSGQGTRPPSGEPVTDAAIEAMAAATTAGASAGTDGTATTSAQPAERQPADGAGAGRTEVFPQRPGSDGEHLVQRWMGSTDRADRFYAEQMLDHLNAPMREFVARQEMFFLATADRKGECDATFRAGPPGFLKVLDARTLVYPEYRGNGVHASLGNISENPHVGLVLVDFTRDRIGLHVNGRARVTLDEDMRRRHPDLEVDPVPGRRAQVWVEVEVEEAYVHCRKHIPRLVKADGEGGERAWGTNDARQKGGDFFEAAADNRAAREAAALSEPVPAPDLTGSPLRLDIPRTPDGFRREAERALERARRLGGAGGHASSGGAPDGGPATDRPAVEEAAYGPVPGEAEEVWEHHAPLDSAPAPGGEQSDAGRQAARDTAEDRSFAWFSQ